MWAPWRQGSCIFCLLQNSPLPPAHTPSPAPRAVPEPNRHSVPSCQITKCILWRGTNFTIQTCLECFPRTKRWAYKGCPLSFCQEILIIMRIIILKGQMHWKKEIHGVSPPPPYLWRGWESGNKKRDSSSGYCFTAAELTPSSGASQCPSLADLPGTPAGKLLPSLQENLMIPEAAAGQLLSVKWGSVGF